MLPVNNAAQVFIATGVTDMRKSINGLSIIVEEELELNPLSGYMFAFCNRKRDIIKILYWDRNLIDCGNLRIFKRIKIPHFLLFYSFLPILEAFSHTNPHTEIADHKTYN